MLHTASPATAGPPSAGTSPPARRVRQAPWSDKRLLLGAVLVVASVAGVTVLVTSSDDRTAVWTATGALSPGMTVTASDVELSRVALPSTAVYLTDADDPVGTVVVRAVGTGELLPSASVVDPGSAPERRLVTVGVERHHLPDDLARGDTVDVYLVERDATGSSVGDPTLVLGSATVDSVEGDGSRFSGSSLETGVVLAVGPDDVTEIVGAAAKGTVVLVRVPES